LHHLILKYLENQIIKHFLLVLDFILSNQIFKNNKNKKKTPKFFFKKIKHQKNLNKLLIYLIHLMIRKKILKKLDLILNKKDFQDNLLPINKKMLYPDLDNMKNKLNGLIQNIKDLHLNGNYLINLVVYLTLLQYLHIILFLDMNNQLADN